MVNGASELRLSPHEMAKIGQLVLQKGQWNGKQIIPAQYIERATQRQVSAPDIPARGTAAQWGYGYLWRTATTPGEDLPAHYAVGYGGQFIYIVPARNTVIVATTDAQSRAVAAKTAAVIREIVQIEGKR
jgi:CubicO group peptidase (beta-lactamase class C family)